ncbi:MAG: anti-sigma factor, partial [Qipengyuania sp.]
RLDFTYLPAEDSLLVGAIGLTADGVHDHEIWFVPPEGELVSLGIVTPGKVVAHDVPDAVAQALHDGSQLVLTREPLGGKPADAGAGPVVAEARFTAI